MVQDGTSSRCAVANITSAKGMEVILEIFRA